MENDSHYWRLVLKDDSIIDIPPHAVPQIKKWIANREPLLLPNRTVFPNEYYGGSFTMSERTYVDRKLIEETAQAFKEPIYTETTGLAGDTEVALEAKWVKKEVPSNVYQKHYASLPGYRVLNSDSTLTTIAFRLPTHLIDLRRVSYCDEQEVQVLTRFR